jgi:hypothetical protein
MNFPERRRVNRFRGGIAVELKNGTGTARDFSASGVYFNTDQSFSPGEPIEFVMLLENSYLGELVRVRCWGKVTRVEPNGEKTGVAAAIASHKFEGTEDPVLEVPEDTPKERASPAEKKGEKGAALQY